MTTTTSLQPQRLVSLDAFRGATMAFMVLVNTAGTGDHVFPPLQHAHWHGWTPTDVVFPSFVWITGLSMTLSLGRRLEAGTSTKSALLLQALRRALILFALGLLIYSFPVPDLGTFRILGVLQRIAIAYFVSAAIYLYSGVRGQVLWTLGFLASYWLLMFYAPVPGYGAGRLDIEGNFAHYIDRIVLGSHNYINTKTWDPEGIVSTLPAIASCLLGILAGHVMALRSWSVTRRARELALLGSVLLSAGLIGDQWLPINKNIWTSTFALFMAGLDCMLFGLFLWVADVLQWGRFFRPLVIMGMNAIAIYMSSELIDVTLYKIPMGASTLRVWLYETLFAPLSSVPEVSSLLYAMAYVALHFVIAWVLFKKNWFIRV
jgi:predicted acyltransferase